MLDYVFEYIIIGCLLLVCYVIGSTIENAHYKKIKERELKLYRSPWLSFAKNVNKDLKVRKAELVSASVVLGCDYFKMFVAKFKNMFGGNISVFESVLDRGRREALLRVREQALKNRANVVVNIKIDTIMLTTPGSYAYPKVCVVAYGTAVEYEK